MEEMIPVLCYGTAEGLSGSIVAWASLEQAMRWTAAIMEVFRAMEKA